MVSLSFLLFLSRTGVSFCFWMSALGPLALGAIWTWILGYKARAFCTEGCKIRQTFLPVCFFFLLCTDALLVPYASCVIEWSLESANKISVTHVGLVLYIVDQHSAMSTALLQVLCFQQCDVPRAGDLQKSGEPNTLWIR